MSPREALMLTYGEHQDMLAFLAEARRKEE